MPAPNRTHTGSVKTQARRILRSVSACKPERFAAIAPAMPEDKTCVVLTGRPYLSANPIVAIAISSAEAPWA